MNGNKENTNQNLQIPDEINDSLKKYLQNGNLTEILSDELQEEIVKGYLLKISQPNKALPIGVIKDKIDEELTKVKDFLINKINEFIDQESIPNLENLEEVRDFEKIIGRTQLSVIEQYLKDISNRRINLKETGKNFIKYFNTTVNYKDEVLNARIDGGGGRIMNQVNIYRIDQIIWETNGVNHQTHYIYVESKKLEFQKFLNTLKILLTTKKKYNSIEKEIEDYDNYTDIGGLISGNIREFKESLESASKVNISVIDKEIEKIYNQLHQKLEDKTAILRGAKRIAELRVNDEKIIGTPLITGHEKEITGGYSVRYIAYDPNKTKIELIKPKELSENEKLDRSRYFPIPYFETSDKTWNITNIPFVMTEQHLNLLSKIAPVLYHNSKINSMLIGLAGTGKDYFIEWLASLMNMRNCAYVCHEVIDISFLFYERRIKNMTDYYTKTPLYTGLTNTGCLLNFSEYNKLGIKSSDLNSLLDYRRCIFISVDGITYVLPIGNLIFTSINPSWFGGGRSKIEFDVKDRFQNIIHYDFLPFFVPNEENGLYKTNLFYSHEAEIRYHLFPQFQGVNQLKFRQFWYKFFQKSSYKESDEKSAFKSYQPPIRAMIVLKNILKFANLYRLTFQMYRTQKTDTVATEILSQRAVEALVDKTVMYDRQLDNYDTHKNVITEYMISKIEDREIEKSTVEQFLKN